MMNENNTVYDPKTHDRAMISIVLFCLGIMTCAICLSLRQILGLTFFAPLFFVPAFCFAVKARKGGNREVIGTIGLILGSIGLAVCVAIVVFLMILLAIPDGVGVPSPEGMAALIRR